MLVSSPDPTEHEAGRAIIEDGNEGLVRLYTDIWEADPVTLALKETDFLGAYEIGAAILVALSLGALILSQSLWLDAVLVLMALVFGAGWAISFRLLYRTRRRLNSINYEWHDVRQQLVQFDGLEEREITDLLKKASAFARDENKIVYYWMGKDPDDDWSYRRRTLKFGFLNDENRVLFRMKYWKPAKK